MNYYGHSDVPQISMSVFERYPNVTNNAFQNLLILFFYDNLPYFNSHALNVSSNINLFFILSLLMAEKRHIMPFSLLYFLISDIT